MRALFPQRMVFLSPLKIIVRLLRIQNWLTTARHAWIYSKKINFTTSVSNVNLQSVLPIGIDMNHELKSKISYLLGEPMPEGGEPHALSPKPDSQIKLEQGDKNKTTSLIQNVHFGCPVCCLTLFDEKQSVYATKCGHVMHKTW
jgi:hypothetical protein